MRSVKDVVRITSPEVTKKKSSATKKTTAKAKTTTTTTAEAHKSGKRR
jgi:hypothetical protein